jgi:hypothetical protein
MKMLAEQASHVNLPVSKVPRVPKVCVCRQHLEVLLNSQELLEYIYPLAWSTRVTTHHSTRKDYISGQHVSTGKRRMVGHLTSGSPGTQVSGNLPLAALASCWSTFLTKREAHANMVS